MIPTIVNEKLVHPFRFYADDTVKEGIRYNNELYELISDRDSHDNQLEVYSLACALAQHTSRVLVTVSNVRYAIWASLRSQNYLENIPQPTASTSTCSHAFLAGTSSFIRADHPAIGQFYKLGATHHPKAEPYQGQLCEIVAVHPMHSHEPMLSVQFPDGFIASGLFFCELEDAAGRQLSQIDFRSPVVPQNHLQEIPQATAELPERQIKQPSLSVSH